MYRFCLCAALLLFFLPVRGDEFVGAWMHTVHQSQYAAQTTQQNKKYLIEQLDALKKTGVTDVLFQVRPSADAFYQSKLEPWSRFLTGTAGKAPVPYWDPLSFIIKEAHARGMKLHAWLNPYRVTTSKNERLPKNHIYHKEPWRFVKYEGDGRVYFDPGLPENRAFVVSVVEDILSRYDVDGIHFDDYFYPYPANGKEFPDGKSFRKYGKGMKRGDWRRRNVDMMIREVGKAIKRLRPEVRFGISPFGVWRNKKNDPRGSETDALQNYDDLYADVLLWAEEGWIDYLIPQLYWEDGHPRAPYTTLALWWAQAVNPRCDLYIGQDAERTMKCGELDLKLDLCDELDAVKGVCWWPAYYVTANKDGIANRLKSRKRHKRLK